MQQTLAEPCCSIRARLSLLLVLVLGAGVMAANFPPRYELRNGDEIFYVQGGLALWEGIIPTAKYAPAGPQTWISWAYAAARTAWDYVRPGPEERPAPGVLRPFVAANRALFDTYRDSSRLREIEIAANDAMFLAAIAAAFGLGWKRGGAAPLATAILAACLTLALPIFVKLSGEARPYIAGWSLGFIALYFASPPRARPLASAIAFGLAIGSRVEMVVLVPLIFIDLLAAEGTRCERLRGLIRYTAVTAMTVLLIAPWTLTNLVGNLRTIATVGFAPPQGWRTLPESMLDVFWRQGLGMALLLVVAALIFAKTWKTRIAVLYVLLLTASVIKSAGWGLQHRGGQVVAIVSFAAVGLGFLSERWPRAVVWVAALTLLLPVIQTGREIRQRRADYAPDRTVAWLNRHVPAGTIVYTGDEIENPLPTAQSADAIWDWVNHTGAWKLKVSAAIKRFGASADDLPIAFSEEDMIMEKGNCRGWYILGSRPTLTDPRFDIRLFSGSPVYTPSVDDIGKIFQQTGGVLVYHFGLGDAPLGLGQPTVQWLGASNTGCQIFCSPDVLARLKDPEHLADW
jgi:hypothetical protein